MAICILPRGFFSSAPFFNVCGGDKHPAAHVFNPEQARLERAFVCWGGCFSAAFPCAPFQRWRRASCRTWASSFCSAVASSNLPRSTSYTKNKQLQLIVSFYKYFGHNNSFMKAKQQKTNNNDKTMRKIHTFCQRTFTHDKPSTKS